MSRPCKQSCNHPGVPCDEDLDKCPAATNYCQVLPDSQFYTDLEQLIRCLELMGKVKWMTPEYMIVGLTNSLKQGYQLRKRRKK